MAVYTAVVITGRGTRPPGDRMAWKPGAQARRAYQLVSGSSCVRMELSILSVCANLCSSSFSWFSADVQTTHWVTNKPNDFALRAEVSSAQTPTCLGRLLRPFCECVFLRLIICRLDLRRRRRLQDRFWVQLFLNTSTNSPLGTCRLQTLRPR